MHQDTLAGTYSQYTGKAPQNFLFFLLNVKISLCTRVGESPSLLTKKGSLVPRGQRALAQGRLCTLLHSRAADCSSAAAVLHLKNKWDRFSYCYFPSLLFCRFLCFADFLSHRYWEVENLTGNI